MHQKLEMKTSCCYKKVIYDIEISFLEKLTDFFLYTFITDTKAKLIFTIPKRREGVSNNGRAWHYLEYECL